MDNKKTTIFKQEQPQSWPSRCWKRQVTYRIPALIYISENKTYLAFAEERKSPSDIDAEVFVMKRGKWEDDKNTVQVLDMLNQNHKLLFLTDSFLYNFTIS